MGEKKKKLFMLLLRMRSLLQIFLFYFRVALSEAHAKLSLRTTVLEEDVLIAVLLVESSLTLKHGKIFFTEPCHTL